MSEPTTNLSRDLSHARIQDKEIIVGGGFHAASQPVRESDPNSLRPGPILIKT